MFKTEEQVNTRLNSEKNLANRFGKVPAPTGAAQPHDSGATAPAQVVEIVSVPEPLPVLIPPPTSTTKPPNVETKILQQPGNKKGNKKLAFHQRNEIAVRSRLGESQTALADEFGVSQNTISAIERGKTKVDERMINERLDDVQDIAMSKLLASLGYMTSEKLEKLDPVKLSMVASNMGRVISGIRRNDDDGPKVIVQIYAPELKKESSFKSIDV